MKKAFTAEVIGTFWLVLGGCGSAVLAGSKIGYLGISLAFGLTVLTMAFAIGHVSGCHLNPAVSLGLWAAGRFETKKLVPYIIAQVIGAILASACLWLIQSGIEGFSAKELSFAVNGYGALSPAHYNFTAAMVTEIVLTFIFLIVICGATSAKAPQGGAPVAIGLCLTLIHLVGIPVTNLSVNPARSAGPAIMQAISTGDTAALAQLWFFWAMPIIGAVLAGFCAKCLFKDTETK